MAQSSCIKCGSHSFELKELKVTHAQFKLNAIQCSACGGVVGIQEYMNIGAMLHKQNAALKIMAAKLGIAISLD